MTSGLDMGAGPGSEVLMSPEAPPDLREIVLEYLYWTYDNKDAFDLLYQLREERAAKGQQGPVPEAISRPSRTQQEVGAEEEEAPPEL